MSVWRRRFGGLLVALLIGASPSAAAPAGPRRVVSLNPCLDGILMAVADPGQIAALSHWSRDPSQTPFAAAARRFPYSWGSAEEVVALRPDLVLTSGIAWSGLDTLLPRLRIRKESFTVPDTVEESLAQVRRVAVLVGRPDRGEAVVARIRAAIEAAAPRPGEPRLGALIYEHNGLASGRGTLVDELMRRAGFDNLATAYGLRATGEVPLERVVADPPQVLLAGRLAAGEPVWADRVLAHPALAALARRMRRETFPETLMYCGGPSIIPAIEALAEARENALAGRSR
jgi:iron complex transport system substrate-binding protein